MNETFTLVGCGNIIPKHIDAIYKAGGIVTALCDISQYQIIQTLDYINKLNKSVENISTYTDYTQIKKASSNYLVVATPHDGMLHYEISKWGLENGFNVIVEKPAMKAYEFKKLLIDIAKNKYLGQLIPVMQNRFLSDFVLIKDRIKNNNEKIISISCNVVWSRNNEYYSGWRGKGYDNVVSNQAIHHIDLCLQLAGIDMIDGKVQRLSEYFGDIKKLETFDYFSGEYILNKQIHFRIIATTADAFKNRESNIKILTNKDYYEIDLLKQPQNQYNGYKGSASLHPMLYNMLLKAPHLMYNASSAVAVLDFVDKIHENSIER